MKFHVLVAVGAARFIRLVIKMTNVVYVMQSTVLFLFMAYNVVMFISKQKEQQRSPFLPLVPLAVAPHAHKNLSQHPTTPRNLICSTKNEHRKAKKKMGLTGIRTRGLSH